MKKESIKTIFFNKVNLRRRRGHCETCEFIIKCTKRTNASRIMKNLREPHKRGKFLEFCYSYTTNKGSKLRLRH